MGFKSRRIGTFDLDTGERLDGNQVLQPLRKPGIDGDFMMIKQDALERIALDSNLNGKDLKVLLLYWKCADYENYIRVEQKWIAEKLGIRPQHVYRSTKKLIEAKILIEDCKEGRHRVYRLSEFYGWKGDSRNYQKKVKEDVRLG